MQEPRDAADPDNDALFASLYSELHRLAQSHLRHGGPQGTSPAFPDRVRFFKYDSRAMRT